MPHQTQLKIKFQEWEQKKELEDLVKIKLEDLVKLEQPGLCTLPAIKKQILL